MTTDQHLDAILRKCRAILDIAERRTPGRWDAFNGRIWPMGEDYPMGEIFKRGNAQFISASAGALEAGCRATIAAIEGLRMMMFVGDKSPLSQRETWILQSILAAWPEEILS